MFEHLNRQRKQKNWKILNMNFNEIQEQSQYNRSSIIEPNKKYCPKKDTSKQKIFSKSKQRINQSASQTPNNNSFYLRGLSKQANLKQSGTKLIQNQNQLSKDQKRSLIQQNSGYKKTVPYQQKDMSLIQNQVLEEYQMTPQVNVRKSAIIRLNNSQFQEVLSTSNHYQKMHQALSTQSHDKLKEQINHNSIVINLMKQQFEEFKSLVITELNQEKEFLRQTIQRIIQEFEFIKSKVRQQIYQEMHDETQSKRKSLYSSLRQSRKNSTEIKIEQIFKLKESQCEPINPLESPRILNIETFGIIQQPSVPEFVGLTENELLPSEIRIPHSSQDFDDYALGSSENVKIIEEKLSQQQVLQEILSNDHKQELIFTKKSQQTEPFEKNQKFCTQTEISEGPEAKEILTKELRTYKSSGNFILAKTAQQNIKQQPQAARTKMTSQHTLQSASKSVISSKRRIQQPEEVKRYSEILKKQYEQKSKASSHIMRIDKEKISQKLNHLSKFQGAMQKLKSEIMQIKNISDTKDLKRIKFSEQRPKENYLKQLKLNEINGETLLFGDQAAKDA